jgi:hypothetical protein
MEIKEAVKMVEIIKELNIEVSKPNVFQAVVAKQYDMNTRFIKATFVDFGQKIEIPQSDTLEVRINAQRPDGEAKGFKGEINTDGTATVPLHSWMLEQVGTVTCDISVIDMAEGAQKQLTTTSFTLLVEKAAWGGEGMTNDPQYNLLIELLDSCSSAGQLAEEALETAGEALEKANRAEELVDGCEEATNTLVLTHKQFVEGGYVEALKEMNNGGKLLFWIGTEEEYEQDKDSLPANTLCLTTDSGDKFVRVGSGNYGEEIPNFGNYDNEAALENSLSQMIDEDIPVVTPIRFRCSVADFGGVQCGTSMWDCDVVRTSENYAIFTARSLFTGANITAVRKIYANGVWLPVEWDNPPMANGVEYRTSERCNSVPVYVMTESFTVPPAGETVTGEAALDEFARLYVVDIAGCVNVVNANETIAYPLGLLDVSVRADNPTNSVVISVSNDNRDLAGGNVKVLVKYTKE